MKKARPVPAVSAVILNKDKEILLTLRSKKVLEPGKWCIPGGHFDPGDTWIEAIAKEVSEETGLTILNPILMGVYSRPELTLFRDKKTGETTHYLVSTFLVTEFEGQVVTNDEVDDWRWCRLDNLPDPMIYANLIQIQDAFQFEGKVFVR